MKFTIELDRPEVDGIKKYLESTGTENATNEDVKEYINGLVKSTIYAPQEAVSDFIYQAQ